MLGGVNTTKSGLLLKLTFTHCSLKTAPLVTALIVPASHAWLAPWARFASLRDDLNLVRFVEQRKQK
jgi:hypothetical protein